MPSRLRELGARPIRAARYLDKDEFGHHVIDPDTLIDLGDLVKDGPGAKKMKSMFIKYSVDMNCWNSVAYTKNMDKKNWVD